MIKLKERKYLTGNAREQLIDFLKSFDFERDITTVSSSYFDVRLDIGDSRYDFINISANFTISADGLLIHYQSEEDKRYDCHRYESIRDFFSRVYKMNFAIVIYCFNEVVGKYNESIEEVEKDIKTFVDFYEKWKAKVK